MNSDQSQPTAANPNLSIELDKANESKKQKKRREKKERRLRLSLEDIGKVAFGDVPTDFLLIGNGGLANQVRREDIERLLSTFAGFVELEMPPSETFCFAKFTSSELAAEARDVISGYILQTPNLPMRSTVSLLALFVKDRRSISLVIKKSSPPEGLHILENYIDESQETALLDVVRSCFMESDDKKVILKQRQVKHFGYEFIYGTNTVEHSNPLEEEIPPVCHPFLYKLLKDGYIQTLPDQLTVNRYEPGQGIPPHVDTHSVFGDSIVSVTCGSQTVMDFREPDSGRTESVVLRPRSVLVMTGPARYQWSHGIASRRADLLPDDSGMMTWFPRGVRISFTFRKVLQEPFCNCLYSDQCDFARRISSTQSSSQAANDTRSFASKTYDDAASLEQRHVHEVYDSIADHFSSTRHSPWPLVSKFIKDLPVGSVVIDVGCGNGKYLNVNPHLNVLAADRSAKLCDISYTRYASQPSVGGIMVADILQLPLRSESVDSVICIAVLHHLASRRRRKDALKELSRIVHLGGLILITVWAFEQTSPGKTAESTLPVDPTHNNETGTMHASSQYVKENRQHIPNHLFNCHLPIHTNRTAFKEKDMLVPWHMRNKSCDTKDGEKYFRYYHLFVQNELEDMCTETGILSIVESYYDKGNWCVISKRIK